MSTNITTFEVRIRIKGAPIEYYDYYGEYLYNKAIKMLHIDARTPEQAREKAKKHGDVVSCRKADVSKMLGDIEHLKLDQTTAYNLGNPYKDAVAMDEMIWQKRNNRRNNLHKDKKGLDK